MTIPNESILSEAEHLTNHERQQSYGHPLDNYEHVAAVWSAAFAHKLKEPFTAEESLMAMVLLKACREIHQPKRDNRVDLAGYTNCIQMAIDERERRESSAPEQSPST